MKFEYGIIGVLGFFVFLVIGLISYQPSHIPYWDYLHDIKQQHFEPDCNTECKSKAETWGFVCAQIETESYICRPPREIHNNNQDVQTRSTVPIDYGEFAFFPQGKADVRMFDIAHIDVINPDTKEIKIEFGYHFEDEKENQFSYSATFFPGQTFVSHCIDETGIVHTVEYLDIFEMQGKTYIEFWGSHAILPEQLLPCKMPDLIKHSIPIDYSLAVDFELSEN